MIGGFFIEKDIVSIKTNFNFDETLHTLYHEIAHRIFKTDKTVGKESALQEKFDELYSELDWLGNEYRSCISDGYGLFTWKKIPEHDTPRPFFRLESALKIKKLQECVQKFVQWEASFNSAFDKLERGFAPVIRRFEE